MKLFAKENTNNKEVMEAIAKMKEQIKEYGGRFTFDVVMESDGWHAQCREYSGIITGGKSRDPSEQEVFESMIDAIKTAFHIPIEKLKIEEQQATMPKIEIVREFQFTY